jgi:hypothetical protein
VTNEGIRDAYERGFLEKEEYEFFDMFWGSFKTVMHFPARGEADKMLSTNLVIEEVFYCDEWFREFCPTYLLKRRI